MYIEIKDNEPPSRNKQVKIVLSKYVLHDLKREAENIQEQDTHKILKNNYPILNQFLEQIIYLTSGNSEHS